MLAVCTGCASKLSFNHKTDRPLRELRCPHCGGHYRKAVYDPGRPDPLTDARVLAARMEAAAGRIETALKGVYELAPALAELGAVLQDVRGYSKPRLLKGGVL